MRRFVQFFHDNLPTHGTALCALADDGTVWRRVMTGYGDHGFNPPTTIVWERDERYFPPLPQE